MPLRYRSMLPKDVPECVSIIARHTVIGPRYGKIIAQLGAAWLKILGSDASATVVVEDATKSPATICFVGVAVFVCDEFVRIIKASPLRWVGPELVRRVLSGESPLLSDSQLCEANSAEGLTTVTWEGCIRPGYEQHTEVHRKVLSAFIEHHRGYLWKEAIASQIESVERLQWTLQTGGLLWDERSGQYVESLNRDLREIIENPHVVGVTRDMEHRRPGTWVGSLFDYHPPKCGFSRSEQRLLLSALNGDTDTELAAKLDASLPAVKKKWLSIYRRIAVHLPELVCGHSESAVLSERGKEKRRHLLAYLREHPEELRPILRQPAIRSRLSTV